MGFRLLKGRGICVIVGDEKIRAGGMTFLQALKKIIVIIMNSIVWNIWVFILFVLTGNIVSFIQVYL